jgi:hypothetical protein
MPLLRGWILQGSTPSFLRSFLVTRTLPAEACDQGLNDRRDKEDEY